MDIDRVLITAPSRWNTNPHCWAPQGVQADTKHPTVRTKHKGQTMLQHDSMFRTGLFTHTLKKLHKATVNRRTGFWTSWVTQSVTKVNLIFFCCAVHIGSKCHDWLHKKLKQASLSISVPLCCWNWPLFLLDTFAFFPSSYQLVCSV